MTKTREIDDLRQVICTAYERGRVTSDQIRGEIGMALKSKEGHSQRGLLCHLIEMVDDENTPDELKTAVLQGIGEGLGLNDVSDVQKTREHVDRLMKNLGYTK